MYEFLAAQLEGSSTSVCQAAIATSTESVKATFKER